MRLSKEERWQLKLIRLIKEVHRRHPKYGFEYNFEPNLEYFPHVFAVYDYSNRSYVVIDTEYESGSTAEEVYKWALHQCKRKGLI